MTRKMDALGESYTDPLDYGRDGYINEEFGDCHEYGGGFRMTDEIALDHIRHGGSFLTAPRVPVFKPRRIKADNEYAEARYLNAFFDCKKQADKYAESNAATMRSLFRTINQAAE